MTDGKFIALAILLGAGLVAWQLRSSVADETEFAQCSSFVTKWNDAQTKRAQLSAAVRDKYQAARDAASKQGDAEAVAQLDRALNLSTVWREVPTDDVILSACTNWSSR